MCVDAFSVHVNIINLAAKIRVAAVVNHDCVMWEVLRYPPCHLQIGPCPVTHKSKEKHVRSHGPTLAVGVGYMNSRYLAWFADPATCSQRSQWVHWLLGHNAIPDGPCCRSSQRGRTNDKRGVPPNSAPHVVHHRGAYWLGAYWGHTLLYNVHNTSNMLSSHAVRSCVLTSRVVRWTWWPLRCTVLSMSVCLCMIRIDQW